MEVNSDQRWFARCINTRQCAPPDFNAGLHTSVIILVRQLMLYEDQRHTIEYVRYED